MIKTLFVKESIDLLPDEIAAKKQSLGAITEVSKPSKYIHYPF